MHGKASPVVNSSYTLEIMILRANKEHIDELIKTGSAAFLQAHAQSAPVHEIECYVARKYSRENVLKELADPHTMFHFFKDQNKLAGYSKLILDHTCSLIAEPAVCKLEQLYFLAQFTGSGSGAKLLEHNMGLSRRLHQKGIWLEVWTGNKRAIKFYEKYGFRIVGSGSFPLSATHANPYYVMYLKY